MLNIKSLVSYVTLAVMSFASLAQSQDVISFDRSSFGKAVWSQTESTVTDIQLELSIGDYKNEPIINYSDRSDLVQFGRSVGRLDVLTDKGIHRCTAFIVSKQHILTNYHCSLGVLENARLGATRIDAITFIAGYTQTGVEEGTRKYVTLANAVEFNKQLDYAVLEVIGDPSAEYGELKLASLAPQSGDPFWIIGHPMGEGQRVSREKCRASEPAVSVGKLLHTCDTLPGNSGSPVIDISLRQVVALHHAGSKKDSVNFAILMSEILKNSKVLSAYKAPISVQPLTPKITEMTACDALYSEAKEAKACFAYEAYFKSCRSHSLAPIAEGYLEKFCQVQTTSVGGNCNDTLPERCADAEVCSLLLDRTGPTTFLKIEAKKRGLTCGIGVAEIKAANFKKTFTSQPKLKRQQLQYALKKLGYYSFGIDGLWGKGTASGFDKFVNRNSLKGKTEAQVLSNLLSKVKVPNSFKQKPIFLGKNWALGFVCSGTLASGKALFYNRKDLDYETRYTISYVDNFGEIHEGLLKITGAKMRFRMESARQKTATTGSGKFNSSYSRAEGKSSGNCHFYALKS